MPEYEGLSDEVINKILEERAVETAREEAYQGIKEERWREAVKEDEPDQEEEEDRIDHKAEEEWIEQEAPEREEGLGEREETEEINGGFPREEEDLAYIYSPEGQPVAIDMHTSGDPVVQLGLDLIHNPDDTEARLRTNEVEASTILEENKNGWTEQQKNESREKLRESMPGLAAREREYNHYASIAPIRQDRAVAKQVEQSQIQDIKLTPSDFALLNAPWPEPDKQNLADYEKEKPTEQEKEKQTPHAIKIERAEIKKVIVPDPAVDIEKKKERPL